MEIIQKLIRLEENYKRIEDGNKIVRDATHIGMLNKMKNDFQGLKAKYLEKKEKIEEIENEYINISNKINSENEELKNVQNKLFNSNMVVM
jgi:predicted  nucleic acid-binding Zn-ribbon protein